MIDLTSMTVSEIESLRAEADAELERRRVINSGAERIEEISTEVLAAEGISDGQEWQETILGYPVGYTVTYPLPDGSGEGTWLNRTSQNRYAPGSEGGGWELQPLDEDTPPLWVKPAWAELGYDTGDEVTFPTYEDGTVYRSLIDRNTWSPLEYPEGWERLTESQPDPDPGEPGEDIPVWVRPVWAGQEGGAYALGDQVHYPDASGPVYESTHNGWNTWAPDEYGWELV